VPGPAVRHRDHDAHLSVVARLGVAGVAVAGTAGLAVAAVDVVPGCGAKRGVDERARPLALVRARRDAVRVISGKARRAKGRELLRGFVVLCGGWKERRAAGNVAAAKYVGNVTAVGRV
jgi:hypothetical protein